MAKDHVRRKSLESSSLSPGTKQKDKMEECNCTYMTMGEHALTCPSYERDKSQPCNCCYMTMGEHALTCPQYEIEKEEQDGTILIVF